MMIIGLVLILVAAVLIALGVIGTAATWILYLGIALVVVGAIFVVLDRQRAGRR
jgi:hypothetical protein